MYLFEEEKSTQKALFYQNAKNTPFLFCFFSEVTKLKLGLHIYIWHGQDKFDFELIRTKNLKKNSVFLRSTQYDENLAEHLQTFLLFIFRWGK